MTDGKEIASAAPPINIADGMQMSQVESVFFSFNTSDNIIQNATSAQRYMEDDVIQKKISPVPGMSRKNEIANNTVKRECCGSPVRRINPFDFEIL